MQKTSCSFKNKMRFNEIETIWYVKMSNVPQLNMTVCNVYALIRNVNLKFERYYIGCVYDHPLMDDELS